MTQLPQNTSHAVMAQRNPLLSKIDDFPTPPWATRALIEQVLKKAVGLTDLHQMSVWEPACNRGYMAKPMSEYFKTVYATDVVNYGWSGQQQEWDYISTMMPNCIGTNDVDMVITNPPFSKAEKFIKRSMFVPGTRVVAMLCRTGILESNRRYKKIFSIHPPSYVAQFVERVPMLQGKVDPKASTATAYCWLVWVVGVKDTRLSWIPPCRSILEKGGDYS